MKPIKKALALVIKNDQGDILVVKRPEDEDGPLAGVWGFPAVVIKDDETEEDAAKRVGTQKLGVKVTILDRIGERTGDRGGHNLILCDYEARISDGVPIVPQEDETVTQYIDYKYTSDPSILFPAANRGSLCSQVYLSSINTSWQ